MQQITARSGELSAAELSAALYTQLPRHRGLELLLILATAEVEKVEIKRLKLSLLVFSFRSNWFSRRGNFYILQIYIILSSKESGHPPGNFLFLPSSVSYLQVLISVGLLKCLNHSKETLENTGFVSEVGVGKCLMLLRLEEGRITSCHALLGTENFSK